MSDVAYSRHPGEQMLSMLYEVANLYDEIHSDMPEEQGGIFSRQSFLMRTAGQAQAPGFELVTATSDDLLIGFSFGHPMPVGRWWGDCTPAPDDILNASKFAVIELDVRKSHRRQGIAKTLLDLLFRDREEVFATLASTPGTVANAMYKRWGWYKVGVFTDSMEALVVPMRFQGNKLSAFTWRRAALNATKAPGGRNEPGAFAFRSGLGGGGSPAGAFRGILTPHNSGWSGAAVGRLPGICIRGA